MLTRATVDDKWQLPFAFGESAGTEISFDGSGEVELEIPARNDEREKGPESSEGLGHGFRMAAVASDRFSPDLQRAFPSR